jgi:hypothetical protein
MFVLVTSGGGKLVNFLKVVTSHNFFRLNNAIRDFDLQIST